MVGEHDEAFSDRDALVDDAFLEAELDRAMGPYEPMLPAEALREQRELLGDYLAAHPLGRKLLDRARPRPALQRSDVVHKVTGESACRPAEPRRPARGGK